jgi:hypothetical protein
MWRPRSRAGYGAVLLLGSIALLLLLNAREILLVPPTIALGGKSLDQIFPDPRKVRDHYRQPQQQIQNGGEERRSATRTKIWPFKPHTAPSSWELGVEPWYQARKSAVCLTFDDNPGPLETPGPGLLDEMVTMIYLLYLCFFIFVALSLLCVVFDTAYLVLKLVVLFYPIPLPHQIL